MSFNDALLKILSLMEFIPRIGITDVIEIGFFVLLIYKLMKNLKNTRAWVLLKGILLFFVFYVIAFIFQFNAFLVLFRGAITIGLIAIIVVFQTELRKILEKLGTRKISINNLLGVFKKQEVKEKLFSDETLKSIKTAVYSLSEAKTGALIVFEKDIPLNDYISTGISLNADVSSALLINIFEKNTPLHDGAIIIRKDKIVAGTCYLPLTESKLNKKMGTRHRAAVGVTEVTDAFVITVSEETGSVSIINGGKINHNISEENFTKKMKEHQTEEKITLDVKNINVFDRLKNNTRLKFLSLFLGIIFWMTLISTINPVVSQKFDNIPVTIINSDALTSVGKTYNAQTIPAVSVTLKDRRSVIDSITKVDIEVVADLSKLSYVYAVPLTASIKNNSTTEATLGNVNSITVELSDLVDKEFPLTIKKTGVEADGYYINELTPNHESIIVSGPDYIVKTIDRVETDVDVTDAKEGFSTESIPTIYDKNGNLIDVSLIKLNYLKISFTADFFRTKIVPLNITVTKKADSLYNIKDVSYTPQSITIAGTEKKLKSIQELDINIESSENIQNQVDNQYEKIINMPDYLPDGIIIANSEQEKVSLYIKFEPYQTKKITFSNKDIRMINLKSGVSAQIENAAFEVTVVGPSETIDSITLTTLSPYINLDKLGSGNFNLMISYSQIKGAIIQTNLSVKITIK